MRLIAALLVGAASLMAAAAPRAEAASYGWVYVVVNHNACGVAGAQVRDVQGNFNWGSGSSTINWEGDSDNVVYPRVQLNTRVSYQVNARCFKKYNGVWITVGYRALTGYFTPSYHQQTIWVG